VYKAAIVDVPGKSNDVRETINYRKALEGGVKIIQESQLTQGVIRQIHQILMDGVRGQTKSPGKYRSGEVWIGARGTGIGAARYVPPGCDTYSSLMEELESFIDTTKVHPLIACGIIHHRFEAIHPFEDGNGRTGRLVVTLYLLKTGMLAGPILYQVGILKKIVVGI